MQKKTVFSQRGPNYKRILLSMCTIYLFFLVYSLSAGYVRLDEHMKVLTKYKGENLRIRCEITGFPVPKYQWFKDDKPLRDGGKFNIRITPWGSR